MPSPLRAEDSPSKRDIQACDPAFRPRPFALRGTDPSDRLQFGAILLRAREIFRPRSPARSESDAVPPTRTMESAHYHHRPASVLYNILGHRAEQEARKLRAAAVAHDDQVHAVPVGIVDDLLRRVPHHHIEAAIDARLGKRLLQRLQKFAVVLARVLDDGLGFHVIADIRRARHRKHVQFCSVLRRELQRGVERLGARFRAVVTDQDLPIHGHPRLAPGAAAGAACSELPTSSALGNKWRGMNQALAIRVGTTALAITAATSAEYCAWSTIWCDKPNNAEIVPNVRPVDMSSVVYIPSFLGEAKIRVTG